MDSELFGRQPAWKDAPLPQENTLWGVSQSIAPMTPYQSVPQSDAARTVDVFRNQNNSQFKKSQTDESVPSKMPVKDNRKKWITTGLVVGGSLLGIAIIVIVIALLRKRKPELEQEQKRRPLNDEVKTGRQKTPKRQISTQSLHSSDAESSDDEDDSDLPNALEVARQLTPARSAKVPSDSEDEDSDSEKSSWEEEVVDAEKTASHIKETGTDVEVVKDP